MYFFFKGVQNIQIFIWGTLNIQRWSTLFFFCFVRSFCDICMIDCFIFFFTCGVTLNSFIVISVYFFLFVMYGWYVLFFHSCIYIFFCSYELFKIYRKINYVFVWYCIAQFWFIMWEIWKEIFFSWFIDWLRWVDK